ncbi:MAG TPA: NADH-quinone oxidoreductase subunit H [Thermoplasmata archaeon]|nr:NADH-quinone oxidoreductase subunit H [Thermoplasmata archaeon]
MSIETILLAVFGTILVTIFGIVFGLIYKGIDRKLVARLQSRIGPPIIQPFYDLQKLRIKENIVPHNAVPWLFHFAPILSLTTSILLLLYIPIGGKKPILDGYGDIILVLYLLALPSLGLILGGFASSSPYASVGAQREMVMMMSYEFPLAVVVSAIAWRLTKAEPSLDVFSLSTLAEHSLWDIVGPLGAVGFLMLFIAIMAVVPANLVKIPFDAPEAETEIAGGLIVEYSGTNLAMFYLADAVRTVAVGSLVIALFIPHNLSSFLGIDMGFTLMDINIFNFILDFLFYLLKLFLVIFVGVTVVRAATARLKIAQITSFYWLPTTLMALGGLALLVIDYSF